ncbi:nucloid associated Lsr2-like [Gordonia phage Neville]|uniref:Lsr2-like DNA bridging protein n=1 Tax=Gordonia phage Neville TaxID=2301693 RepID=A0A385DY05_9CAUD|nr:nucloid associated Lsr2-like [Gordonia phage Neville]AXQ64410.1 Lsr2-like DNA bridging protein [Gordonia phage Neville]
MRQEVVRILDDFDGKVIENEEPVVMEFSVEGEHFSLDLRPSNVTRFEADMAKWTDKATKVGGRKRRRVSAAKGDDKPDLNAIREWARGQGYNVSDKGRIPKDIMEAYELADA